MRSITTPLEMKSVDNISKMNAKLMCMRFSRCVQAEGTLLQIL